MPLETARRVEGEVFYRVDWSSDIGNLPQYTKTAPGADLVVDSAANAEPLLPSPREEWNPVCILTTRRGVSFDRCGPLFFQVLKFPKVHFLEPAGS
jgi:hypothetical protein